MKTEKRQKIDCITQDFTCSVVTQEYLIKDDGTEAQIGEEHRQAVTPLDIDQIDHLTPEIQLILKTLWTKDVVKKYKKKVDAILAKLPVVEVKTDREMPEVGES